MFRNETQVCRGGYSRKQLCIDRELCEPNHVGGPAPPTFCSYKGYLFRIYEQKISIFGCGEVTSLRYVSTRGERPLPDGLLASHKTPDCLLAINGLEISCLREKG
jgi:hypothetical protein